MRFLKVRAKNWAQWPAMCITVVSAAVIKLSVGVYEVTTLTLSSIIEAKAQGRSLLIWQEVIPGSGEVLKSATKEGGAKSQSQKEL